MHDINGGLLLAVQDGNLEKLRDLINQIGLTKSEGYGYVLLRTSIILKHTEITKLLLSSGAKVNSKRSKQIPSNTPLHFAVRNGDIQIIKMLLDNNADVNARNGSGWTPLLDAVEMDSKEIVDLLLRRGSYLNDYKCISPLQIAVQHGFYKMTEKLLQLGTPVNLVWETGEQFTPLLRAIKFCGDFSIVELLLKHGANVNSKTVEGLTPLHFASERGNVEIIKLLLSHNADVNAFSDKTITPLYLAVQNSHREAAKCLMDKGANIDAYSKNGETVLNLAVCKRLPMLVEDILKFRPDKNNMGNKNVFKIAVKNSYGSSLAIVQSLLKYGFSLDAEDANVLMQYAIQAGCIGIVQHIIKEGLHLACYNQENCKFLHIAAKHKEVEIAKLLLTNGADVNATDEAGKCAIYYSTERSDVVMTRLLLSHGASVEKSPELLRVAVRKLCKEMVEILLQNNVDIEATDEHGRTALHLSALNEYALYAESFMKYEEPEMTTREKITKLLLSKGANVNAKTTKDKLTALHIACKTDLTNVVEVLLEYKADVNFVVKDCSPLMIAVQQGNASIMKMLIANGATVNSKRENGDTALHIVARKYNRNTDVLDVLLANDADVYSKNNRDATPLHEASRKSDIETISILLEHGSPIDSKDIEGNTALHMAIIAARKEVINILLDFGSDINIFNNNYCTAIDVANNLHFSSRRSYALIYHSDDDLFDLTDHDFGNDERENILEDLKLHLIMLNTANLHVIESNLNFMYTHIDDFTILYKEGCEDEIKQLKIEKISNSKLRFYDILTKNIHSLASYSRNEDIVRVFESDCYEMKFPIYAPMIKRNFEKGNQRRLLLEHAQEFLKCYFELPYDCSDHILRYLSDSDLKNIINVSKTLSTVEDLK